MTKILAYRFSAFGDVAMTVPVITEFLQQNPNIEMVMVSRENFKDLFEGIPNLTFVGLNLNHYKGFFNLKNLALDLIKKYHPDFVADLHEVHRSRILNLTFRLKGYNVSIINKGKKEKKELTNIWNPDKKQLKTTVERYADVFRKMGFKVTLSNQLPINNLPKEGVGFAPFTQHKGKMLPLEKSFELAKMLSKKQKVYFFGGGKEEIQILKDWEQKLPNTESYAGKLTLKEELKKISELKLMISMDSANMHLASLMGTRCISIWGSTHPFAGFLGYGQSVKDVVQVDELTCRPCSVFGKKPCFRGDYACTEEIKLQVVIDKILS